MYQLYVMINKLDQLNELNNLGNALYAFVWLFQPMCGWLNNSFNIWEKSMNLDTTCHFSDLQKNVQNYTHETSNPVLWHSPRVCKAQSNLRITTLDYTTH